MKQKDQRFSVGSYSMRSRYNCQILFHDPKGGLRSKGGRVFGALLLNDDAFANKDGLPLLPNRVLIQVIVNRIVIGTTNYNRWRVSERCSEV